MKYRILAINPGSTSTKIAVYENKDLLFKKSIKHDTKFISSFDNIIDQYSFRKESILNVLKEENIQLTSFDAIVGRGGMLKPIKGGTYLVNDLMIDYVKEATRGEHASNLGCVLAKNLADSINKPSYIVDPVSGSDQANILKLWAKHLKNSCYFGLNGQFDAQNRHYKAIPGTPYSLGVASGTLFISWLLFPADSLKRSLLLSHNWPVSPAATPPQAPALCRPDRPPTWP